MKDLCPRVQLNTSAFCSGGLYRMEAHIPAWTCRFLNNSGLWHQQGVFRRWARMWTNLISVFEFEGSPWNKSMGTRKVIHTGSCQINSLSMIFRNIGWSPNVPSTGQTGHLVAANESFRWFQSVCTSATRRLWTICQSAPRERLLWGLNLTVLSGCLFTWCRQHSVIIPAWLPARHAIPNQRQSNWSSSNMDRMLSGTEWTVGWIWQTLNLHKDCRD